MTVLLLLLLLALQSSPAIVLASKSAVLLSSSFSSASLAFPQLAGYLPAEGKDDAVFSRPDCSVLLVVESDAPASNEEWTPFFKSLSEPDLPNPLQGETVQDIISNTHLERAQAAFGEKVEFVSSALSPESPKAKWWIFRDNAVHEFLDDVTRTRAQSISNGLIVSREEDRLQAELELISEIVSKRQPRVVVATVFGSLLSSTSRREYFHALSAGVERVYKQLNTRAARPLLQIVFVKKQQGASPVALPLESQVVIPQIVQARELSKPDGKGTIPFSGSDYVLMFWVIVFFIFLLLFVFLCIPWAPELDPALRSALKSENKKD